jgi:glycogen phosphorylase
MQTTMELTEEETKGERKLPESVAALGRLAENYWWSWAADGPGVFRDLDPQLWEDCEHNPRCLLNEVTELRLSRMATEPSYTERVRQLAAKFDDYMGAGAQTWARSNVPGIRSENPVAYFCAEFGVHNSLPLYSGGLGILAGDHLKSASDLGLPLVAVGLLYHYGYFRQRLSRDGLQEEHYGKIDPENLPLSPVVDPATGERLRLRMEIRGRSVGLRVWLAEVGRVRLYLLDSNLPENGETDRLITGHLYGGDRETRCVQEIVLGVGGVRLLRALNVAPHVYHLNEGHSAFLTLELARELIAAGRPFPEAAAEVRSRCVFTTHTPVAAGHDEFIPELVEHCLGRDFISSLNLSDEEFFDLGRAERGNERELFGLTPLALKMCRSTNGVSRKHGEVSRELWLGAFPGAVAGEVPITSVTNGVHAPTWVAPLIRKLYEQYVAEDWQERECEAELWSRGANAIPDEELWRAHLLLKQRLAAFVRHRVFHQRLQQGEPLERAQAARTLFDASALTIGFARRVAAYKRWDLLLTDTERLIRLITDEGRPVQFVFAGKAHPQDEGAKLILQQLEVWKNDPRVARRAVFIQDYDQEIARQLVQSVDVWLNVPRRPLEASGTSGEKVAMNGGLNLSVLDGWWLEGYDGTNGWAVGEHALAEGGRGEDEADAESLYRLLEERVVPLYYERDERGVPRGWVRMMKRAIETLVPAFNSDRMVRDYARQIYLGGGGGGRHDC